MYHLVGCFSGFLFHCSLFFSQLFSCYIFSFVSVQSHAVLYMDGPHDVEWRDGFTSVIEAWSVVIGFICLDGGSRRYQGARFFSVREWCC